MNCDICNIEIERKSIKRHLKNVHFLNAIETEKYILQHLGYDVDDIITKYINEEICVSQYNKFRDLFKYLGIIRTHSEEKLTKRYKQKYTNTIQKLYGVDNISQCENIKEKKKNTCIKNYNVKCAFLIPSVREKAVIKLNEFYNFHDGAKVVQATMLTRYGVINPSQLPGVGDKISNTKKEYYATLSLEEKRLMTQKARGNIRHISKLEIRLENILIKCGILFTQQYRLHGFYYDFKIDNILLEINGDYWHGNPKIYKGSDVGPNGKRFVDIWKKDSNKKNIAIKNGYHFITLWESELHIMSDEEVKCFIIKGFYDAEISQNCKH